MGNNQMKYIVYLTKNKVNNKIYIGVHKTMTPYEFDGYLGCGAYIDSPSSYNNSNCYFHKALCKYGVGNFVRYTIKSYDTLEEALALERILVNETFIKKDNNYNMTVGGGMPPDLSKTIYQFDIDGNLIKIWESATKIRQSYNSNVSMNDIINSKRSFAGSFWSYQDHIIIDEYKRECNHGFISQYDIKGNFIHMFKSATEASLNLNYKIRDIISHVFNKKPLNGFYFIKSDVDISNVIKINNNVTIGKVSVCRYIKENGKFDKKYSSLTDAANDTPHTYTSSISNAIKHRYTCGGYLWSYVFDDNYFNIKDPAQKTQIKIKQMDLDMNTIKLWNDIDECKKIYPKCIRCCQNKIKQAHGYVFQYTD